MNNQFSDLDHNIKNNIYKQTTLTLKKHPEKVIR